MRVVVLSRTVWPPAESVTTSRRRTLPPPPREEAKNRDMTRPRAPTTIRITPTTWMLTPETVAVTAQVRIAPAARSTRLSPMRTIYLLGCATSAIASLLPGANLAKPYGRPEGSGPTRGATDVAP